MMELLYCQVLSDFVKVFARPVFKTPSIAGLDQEQVRLSLSACVCVCMKLNCVPVCVFFLSQLVACVVA